MLSRISTARTALVAGLMLAALLTRPAAANIRIEVTGVDAELKRNVMALLSIARYTDRQRLEPDSVERLYRRVDEEVRGALKPYGYYQPVINSAPPLQDKDHNWRLRIEIEPGAPVLVDEVSVIVHGPGATDPHFTGITSAVPMRRGDRLQHQQYEQTKIGLQAVAATYGYLDARMQRSELRVDTDKLRASIYLEIETGERYRFGATNIQQHVIRDERMQRFLRYQQGEPYDANKWLRTQFALDDSRYFSTVTVTPGAPDPVLHVVPIEIQADAAHRTYAFAVGYGADNTNAAAATSGARGSGVRGSVSWFNPRVNTLGHRLQLRLLASQSRQAFDARYDVPFGDPALERMSLAFVDANTNVSSSVVTHELSLTPSITQVMGRWQRVLSATVTHAVSHETGQAVTADDLIVPGLTYASVPKDYLGESLLTRDLNIELLGSNRVLGAQKNFIRLLVNANRELKFAPKWRLLLRAEVGATAIDQTSDLPVQYRFFAGGDVSVRGFANGDLSPVTVNVTDPAAPFTELAGGREVLAGSVEIGRDLPKNTGIAAFFDFGNAVDHFGDPLAYAVGVGFRWRLPGVTLGIDIAQALKDPVREQAQALHDSAYPSLAVPKFPGPHIHLNIAQRL
jgi:translocation and assembly module TamA